ncbi:putative disease resistance protein [Sesamum angolense]|uniref:Disease resistance protein n=1 Tax=Sesamum angolense TaxID=2727404 RepID=A0AAE1T4A7_9LAMI|nr:putative disease resistance protein [Sesamum angolense]
MHSLLKDASKRQDTDNSETIRNWVSQLRDLATQAEIILERKVYQGEAVQRCFEARAWICISQQFQPTTIFKGLLKQLLPHEKEEQHDDDELVRTLYDAQKEKKCLVILDDIWKAEDWNKLRHAFPIGESGSRILLTTRNQNIASTGYVHRLKCLSEDEGWELLQKIALPNNYSQVVFDD